MSPAIDGRGTGPLLPQPGDCADQPLFDLCGRFAVVTGASRGIGAEIAVALAQAGADILGVSRRPGSDRHTASAVSNAGREYVGAYADLADRAAVTSLIARIARSGRSVDILVNNAGTIRRAPAASHSDEAWDDLISVNLTAQFLLAREIGRGMVARGGGKIIFLASMQSFRGGADIIGYAAAKSGLLGVMRTLAVEWAAFGVNVNAIAPGYVETDMTRRRRSDAVSRQEMTARIPAGRWGTPRDIAGAAVFLAAPASDYVNGAILPVDGGWLAR